MQATIIHNGLEIRIDDTDIVNPNDAIHDDDYLLSHRREAGLYVLIDHGFTVCAVFADTLQDALDTAVDEGKLDRYLITDDDASDYPTLNTDNEDGITRLGNASEPFDIDTLSVVALAPMKRSIAAQLAANHPRVTYAHFA